MYYTYILKSEKDKSRYVGVTSDLKKRFQEHNSGKANYMSTKRPYKIVWYGAFTKKNTAYEFESYLKSSSGYAFTKNIFFRRSPQTDMSGERDLIFTTIGR